MSTVDLVETQRIQPAERRILSSTQLSSAQLSAARRSSAFGLEEESGKVFFSPDV
jgi:hypothetical protein